MVLDLLQKERKGGLSWEDSVALFFQLYPEKKSSLQAFFKTEDHYSRKKLKEGLDKKYQELIKPSGDFKNFGISKHKNKPIDLKKLPQELRSEHARLSPLIRDISSNHARLFHCSTNAQRYQIVLRIDKLVSDRRGIFTRIDQFLDMGEVITLAENSKIPLKKDLPVDWEAEHRLKLLRSRKSKLKGNQRRIKEYNQVVQQIEEILKKRHG